MKPAGSILGYVPQQLATSGPHLHFEIRDANGNPVNPDYYRSIFGRLLYVGDQPLYTNRKKKDGSPEWIINPALGGAIKTSGFGPRNISVPGASKVHGGNDYSGGKVKADAQLYWAGTGTYRKTHPEIGEIETINPSTGKKYTVRLVHTKPYSDSWNVSSVPSNTLTPVNTNTGSSTSNTSTGNGQRIAVNVNTFLPDSNQENRSKPFGGDFENIAQKLLSQTVQGLLSQNLFPRTSTNFYEQFSDPKYSEA